MTSIGEVEHYTALLTFGIVICKLRMFLKSFSFLELKLWLKKSKEMKLILKKNTKKLFNSTLKQ